MLNISVAVASLPVDIDDDTLYGKYPHVVSRWVRKCAARRSSDTEFAATIDQLDVFLAGPFPAIRNDQETTVSNVSDLARMFFVLATTYVAFLVARRITDVILSNSL